MTIVRQLDKYKRDQIRKKPVCTGSHSQSSCYTESILHHCNRHLSPTLKARVLESHRLSVFGTDEVGHGLGLGLVVVRSVRAVVNVVVVVVVVAVLGADVLHLVDGTALGATLDGAVAGGGEPDDNVRVGRVAGAANVLLIAEGLDGDGVVERSCVLLAQLFPSHVGSEPRIVLGGALRHLLLPGQTHSFVLHPPICTYPSC